MSGEFDASGIDVAVAGATGEVGRAMLAILAQRRLPVRRLHALASRSGEPGRTVSFREREVPVAAVDGFDFGQAQLALFSMGGGPSKEHAPRAAAQGCLVIDNSSAFRQEDGVPLVVPEVNGSLLASRPARGVIANPNCSTIQLLLALQPLREAAGLEEVYVATYQAVSGAGRTAIDALERQAAAALAGSESDPHGIGFNVVPHIDVFQDNGYTKEEMKIVWESRKILAAPELKVAATAARVPVFNGHSEAVRIVTSRPLAVAEARAALAAAPGVTVVDEHAAGGYPTARGHAAGADDVFVGRIRADLDQPNVLHLWVVADNLRKGAALNAVQIAERLLANGVLAPA